MRVIMNICALEQRGDIPTDRPEGFIKHADSLADCRVRSHNAHILFDRGEITRELMSAFESNRAETLLCQCLDGTRGTPVTARTDPDTEDESKAGYDERKLCFD